MWNFRNSAIKTEEESCPRTKPFLIGCCGADGPNDYLSLRKALPTECRDTVTGNAFFYGCAEEVTWFLEDKSRWTTNIAISIAALEMLISVLSVILVKALQKEEKFNYNR
ncbi:PREDICTED: uncharacterized protein LOC107165321 [Diuraphis noxia]|uniref:uncharacterized protein LOC107165321 n=1 Tax=Diuraphis noxia TaxID=143948 RepID=UPI00076385F6|nr:PREDICTED: uncharacterized protein LOC107165321 [Diuraphis noxia]